MRPTDRVLVFSERCSFAGARGVVVTAEPLTVLLEGERLPMSFSANEVIHDESASDLGVVTNG